MKEQKPQYPASLFWTGVAMNILRSILWLVVATVLMLLGANTPWLCWAGLALLILVVAVALVKQLIYRHTVLHSDTPEFADWQTAMLSPDWGKNVIDMVERAMNDTEVDAYGVEDEDHPDKDIPDEDTDGEDGTDDPKV